MTAVNTPDPAEIINYQGEDVPIPPIVARAQVPDAAFMPTGIQLADGECAPKPFGEPMTYDLPQVQVPESSAWWAAVGAFMHTGTDRVEMIVEHHLLAAPPQRVAMDIETHGVDAGRFSITCVTAAFLDGDGHAHSVLLDPLRQPRDASLVRRIITHASSVVFHNATFDSPVLYAHGLVTREDFDKFEDTIILARLLHTNTTGGRSLEELSVAYGVADDSKVKIIEAMKAAGYKTKEDGYEHCDIDDDFYRRGAMSDTVVTLKLWDLLYDEVMRTVCKETGNPKRFTPVAAPNPRAFLDYDGAVDLIRMYQNCNRVCLRASSRGLALDRAYIARWRKESLSAIDPDVRAVTEAGLRPGVGADVVKYLHATGQLPEDWPVTDNGALKADKAAMKKLEKLGHPIARAHVNISEQAKNENYFKGLEISASATGRVHPSIGVLGAAASGRMSVNNPPLQQFSAEARQAIICDTNHFFSVDWSSIEPVVLANTAGDVDFITPFNEGGDLYIPVAQKAGLIPPELTEYEAKHWEKDDRGEWKDHPGRKKSKTMLLAQMYGQGLKSLAAAHGWTEDEAGSIADGMRFAMQKTFVFMDRVRSRCDETSFNNTLAGRVLEETITKKVERWVNGEPVMVPKTETVARVAVNHFCQGSAADVLYSTTDRLDRMGYGDHIFLWIHDELVTDAVGLSAVKQVMSTPPDFLSRSAATEEVVLRIDAQPMGESWKKV